MTRITQTTMNRALCPLRSRIRDERGQSLIEFVLALPILLVLVFGIIEFASAFRTYQVVTNVAREGARLAVIATEDDADVQARVDSLLVNSGLDLSKRTLTLTCDGAPGTCSGIGTTGTSDEIQLDYEHDFVVLGPVLNLMCAGCGTGYGTVTLTSRAVMRNE